MWRAAGLLAAGGELGGCAALLAAARLPDVAAAFAAAAADAGLAGEPLFRRDERVLVQVLPMTSLAADGSIFRSFS